MKRREFILSLLGAMFLSQLKTNAEVATNDNNIDNDYLNYFEIHIADYCNLNCKYCDHFASIADKNLYPLETFEKDIQQIAKITGEKVRVINLLGGEPLLNPQVDEYLKIARKAFPKAPINLTTNGLLLNSQEDVFWETLKDYNIQLSPTSYPVNINWKAIYKKIEKYGVKTVYGDNFLKDIDKFKVTFFNKTNLDINGTQKDLMKCQSCNNYCPNLYQGKLYACPIIAYIKYFNKKYNQKIIVSKRDFIDIYKTKNLQQIMKWLKQPKPFCRYCKSIESFSKKWESSKDHDISEWT